MLRVTKDMRTMFINTVLETGDPRQVARSGDQLRILDGGFQRVTRYGPELDG